MGVPQAVTEMATNSFLSDKSSGDVSTVMSAEMIWLQCCLCLQFLYEIYCSIFLLVWIKNKENSTY